ncbi:MAG TPA: 50S ribosomal protein L33 [Firmicutes bacterium]|nr:50S ribosomal protein L33 [Bacillota bacterium]
MGREKVFLICTDCLSRNYTIYKSKDNPKRLELMKFCKHCEKHTLHKESK